MAKETNYIYRLVEEDDLLAGQELLYIGSETEIDPSVDPSTFGCRIKLDDNPVRGRNGARYVYYRMIRPPHYSDLLCFVSLEEFLGQFERMPGDWRGYYWLPA